MSKAGIMSRRRMVYRSRSRPRPLEVTRGDHTLSLTLSKNYGADDMPPQYAPVSRTAPLVSTTSGISLVVLIGAVLCSLCCVLWDMQPHETTETMTAPLSVPKDDKPRVVLHVGPRKTGSTSIQDFLQEHSAVLSQNDNIRVHVKNCRNMVFCLFMKGGIREDMVEVCRNSTVEIREFQNKIEWVRSHRGINFVFSAETLDHVWEVDPSKIRQGIFRGFGHIQVVMVYRRFYEWLVSLFGEYYRYFAIRNPPICHRQNLSSCAYYTEWDYWEAYNETRLKNLVTFLTHDQQRIQYLFERCYSTSVYKFYKSAGFDIDVIAFGTDTATNNVVKEFICSPNVHAPNSCTALFRSKDTQENVKGRKEESVRSNQGSTTAYDEIIMSAARAGKINKSSVWRDEAREELQLFMEEKLGLSFADLPKKCLKGETLEMVQSISKDAEAFFAPILGIRFNSAAFDEDFGKFVTSERLCSVHSEEVLKDRRISEFLESLEESSSSEEIPE